VVASDRFGVEAIDAGVDSRSRDRFTIFDRSGMRALIVRHARNRSRARAPSIRHARRR
jgi:hypothetical protein